MTVAYMALAFLRETINDLESPAQSDRQPLVRSRLRRVRRPFDL
jgi:hypothetical protein